LQPEDFVIYDNDITQQVRHFLQDQLPLAIALLDDASESVRPYAPVLQIAGISVLRPYSPMIKFHCTHALQSRQTHRSDG